MLCRAFGGGGSWPQSLCRGNAAGKLSSVHAAGKHSRVNAAGKHSSVSAAGKHSSKNKLVIAAVQRPGRAPRQPVAPRKREVKAKPSKGKRKRKLKTAAVPDVTDNDILHLVGPSRETECEHRRRHPAGRGWEKSCPRCEYIANRTAWELAARSVGPTCRPCVPGETAWLVQKPSFLGGSWGLGCCLCAAGIASQAVLRERAKVGKAYKRDGVAHQRMCRMRTKWARYEHRHSAPSRMQAMIEAHDGSQGHKFARDLLCAPESHLARAPVLEPDPSPAASAEAACSAETEMAACSATPKARGAELVTTADLFKGRVPQVQEWLDAWAECSSSISYLKQARLKRKRGRGGTLNGDRFQLKKWQA